MSQKERIDAIRPALGEVPTGNLPKLTELARQAYERKNTKDCLDLTRAMLLIDPDNADAQSMRSAIQSDLHRDLENARAFLRQPHPAEKVEEPEKPTEHVVPANAESVAEAASDNTYVLPAFLTETVPPPAVSNGLPVRWFVGAAVIVVLGAAAAMVPWFKTKGTVEALPLTLNAADKPNPVVKVDGAQPELPAMPD